MRVYLPSTLSALAELLRAGAARPAPVAGFAVTPALREAYASGDEEELEYGAMTAAARASLRLLAAEADAPPPDAPPPGAAPPGAAPPRRVVLAAEIDAADVRWEANPAEAAAVLIGAEVPVRLIAAGHVDAAQAEQDIAEAIKALPAADAGDDDAGFTVDGAEAHELLWYATQELGDLFHA